MALIPLLAFLFVFKILLNRSHDPRDAFIRASAVWGATVLVSTEALSALHQLSLAPLAIVWLGVIGAALILGGSSVFALKPLSLTQLSRGMDRRFAIPISIVLLVTFVTACVAAPNTWDSMTYHMARVAHWMQNGTVRHYPTHIDRQLFLNPWAEFAILHFQILASGSDRFANLVQWFAFLGSPIAVSAIARLVGLSRLAEWLAAFLVAMTPMAIVQASSTQNDLVCGFWVSCLAYFLIKSSQSGSPNVSDIGFAGLTCALAISTKGTAYIFGAPFLLAWFVGQRRRSGFLAAAQGAALIAAAVIALNLGHFARNFSTFGHPLGNPATLDVLNNEMHGVRPLVSNLTRNIAIHLGTPISGLNTAAERAVTGLHQVLGIDVSDPRTTWERFSVPPLSFHEDVAGNLILMALALVSAIFLFNRRLPLPVRVYAACAFAGFVLFSALLKWQPWHSRLHLPFFILVSVFCAAAVDTVIKKPKVILACVMVTAILSSRWLLRNDNRPFIPGRTFAFIFNTSREAQYFQNRPDQHDGFNRIIDEIAGTPCRDVGLKLGENTWEYPLWAVSRLRGLDVRFRHVEVTENPSGQLNPEHPGPGYQTLWADGQIKVLSASSSPP